MITAETVTDVPEVMCHLCTGIGPGHLLPQSSLGEKEFDVDQYVDFAYCGVTNVTRCVSLFVTATNVQKMLPCVKGSTSMRS